MEGPIVYISHPLEWDFFESWFNIRESCSWKWPKESRLKDVRQISVFCLNTSLMGAYCLPLCLIILILEILLCWSNHWTVCPNVKAIVCYNLHLYIRAHSGPWLHYYLYFWLKAFFSPAGTFCVNTTQICGSKFAREATLLICHSLKLV